MLSSSTIDTNKVTLESSTDFPLTDDECFIDLSDKEELCDSAMIIPIPQHVKETDSCVLEQIACAENKQLFSIALKKMS